MFKIRRIRLVASIVALDQSINHQLYQVILLTANYSEVVVETLRTLVPLFLYKSATYPFFQIA